MPEEIVPGRAYYLASTCHGCPARCGILVKCRDGRPIKIEGNADHPLSRGGVCAVGQAMVLGLYDSLRLGAPVLQGKASDWKSVDTFIAQKLATAKRVRVVSSTLAGPATKRVIADFLARFKDGKHIIYDIPSGSAIAEAHEQTHGVRAVPHYRFDKADVIVSVDADFLGAPYDGMAPLPFKPVILERIAQRLRNAKGASLVVCGSTRLEDQILTNAINELLDNYGATLDIAAPSYQRQGSDRDLAQLVADLADVDALFMLGCNPVYDLPNGDEVARQVAPVPLVVTFASHADETSKHVHAVCPDHHPLESWDDSEPVAGVYSVTQPADLLGHAAKDGPLDDRTARLIKLGVSIGAMREGAVHSSARKPVALGVSRQGMNQVVAIALSIIGMPSAVAVWTWLRDAESKKG